MSSHNPVTSFRHRFNGIPGGRAQLPSSLPRRDNIGSYPQRRYDHAGKETCAPSEATLVEAVIVWRERVRKPPLTDTARRLPGHQNEFIRSDGEPSSCSPGTPRVVLSLPALRPQVSSSPVSRPGFRSNPDAASDESISPATLKSDIVAAKRANATETLDSTSLRAIKEALLPDQSAVIKELVKHGKHLSALAHALQYSYDFTFERRPHEVFSARIHIFNRNQKNEVPGIMMRFHKALNPSFKRYLARRLLNGVSIRYQKGAFPRTFWVAEGGETPVILHTYNTMEDARHTLERCECCRDLEKLWRWEQQAV
ncbi:hypothetical protein GGR55DRAFT_683571 [Xylaria sp. FL0064]|nr:hypothetical protein GGR55DRAFT_683571 [Xylaria sp. FL0064]